jgi:hypothetical protein
MTPFLECVTTEVRRAQAKHAPIHSLHEAFAVILEEVEEFKAEVWKQTEARSPHALLVELIQIAAMCARTAHDLALLEQTRHEALSLAHLALKRHLESCYACTGRSPHEIDAVVACIACSQDLRHALRYGLLTLADLHRLVQEHADEVPLDEAVEGKECWDE